MDQALGHSFLRLFARKRICFAHASAVFTLVAELNTVQTAPTSPLYRSWAGQTLPQSQTRDLSLGGYHNTTPYSHPVSSQPTTFTF